MEQKDYYAEFEREITMWWDLEGPHGEKPIPEVDRWICKQLLAMDPAEKALALAALEKLARKGHPPISGTAQAALDRYHAAVLNGGRMTN